MIVLAALGAGGRVLSLGVCLAVLIALNWSVRRGMKAGQIPVSLRRLDPSITEDKFRRSGRQTLIAGRILLVLMLLAFVWSLIAWLLTFW